MCVQKQMKLLEPQPMQLFQLITFSIVCCLTCHLTAIIVFHDCRRWELCFWYNQNITDEKSMRMKYSPVFIVLQFLCMTLLVSLTKAIRERLLCGEQNRCKSKVNLKVNYVISDLCPTLDKLCSICSVKFWTFWFWPRNLTLILDVCINACSRPGKNCSI